jgi:hypothetical protein
MGRGFGKSFLPIGAKRPDAELGDEHGHDRDKGDVSRGEMAFVEGDFPTGQGVDLGIERCRDVEMLMVRTGGIGMPVVDEKLSVNVIEQAVLICKQFNLPLSTRLATNSRRPNGKLEVEPKFTASSIPRAKCCRQGK